MTTYRVYLEDFDTLEEATAYAQKLAIEKGDRIDIFSVEPSETVEWEGTIHPEGFQRIDRPEDQPGHSQR